MKALFPLILMLSVASCQSSNFSGDSGKADPVPPTAAPSSAPATASPVPTAAPTATPCVGDGITQAKLLTTSIKSQAPGQYLDYELQLTDCDGKPKAISNQPLKFDLDARTDSLAKGLAYQLSVADGSSNQINDVLQSVRGSDLFNKTGSQYAHWQTQSISYAAASVVIKLRLDVSNRLLLPINSQDSTLKAPVTIPTYLQLGTAAPVQQDITVSP